MQLNEPKLLIALILEDFAKERDLVVLLNVRLHALDDGGGPVHDERAEAVLLIEVGVHELLHRLHWQLRLSALYVVLYFLLVDVVDDVLQLLEGQDFLALGLVLGQGLHV